MEFQSASIQNFYAHVIDRNPESPLTSVIPNISNKLLM